MSGSVGQPTQSWFPFVASKVNTTWDNRVNTSTDLAMGHLQSTGGSSSDAVSWDTYLDSVTWKVAIVLIKDVNRGIITIKFNGSSVGTIDGYAAATTPNTYAEVTGIVVATPAVTTVQLATATKNASSSAYYGDIQSVALIATSGVYSTPNGTDTPGYTWEYLPFMGTKSNTAWATRTQSSAELAGGRLDTDSTVQNNLLTTDMWGDTGTYKEAFVHRTGPDRGIYNVTGFSGTQTVDGYAAGATDNVYSEVTGITQSTAGVKTIQIQMATKNASSSAYGGSLQSVKFIRTGA